MPILNSRYIIEYGMGNVILKKILTIVLTIFKIITVVFFTLSILLNLLFLIGMGSFLIIIVGLDIYSSKIVYTIRCNYYLDVLRIEKIKLSGEQVLLKEIKANECDSICVVDDKNINKQSIVYFDLQKQNLLDTDRIIEIKNNDEIIYFLADKYMFSILNDGRTNGIFR